MQSVWRKRSIILECPRTNSDDGVSFLCGTVLNFFFKYIIAYFKLSQKFFFHNRDNNLPASVFLPILWCELFEVFFDSLDFEIFSKSKNFDFENREHNWVRYQLEPPCGNEIIMY